MSLAAFGRGVHGAGNGGVEERLSAVEKNLEIVWTELDGYHEGMKNLGRDVARRVDEERAARVSEATEIRRSIEEHAVGSARDQLAGLVLFIVGVTYATIPDWLAAMVR